MPDNMDAATVSLLINKLETIDSRIEQVHEAVYGNGDPGKGMLASQVRQEAAMKIAAEQATAAAAKAEELSDKLVELAGSVDRHHKSLHLASLVKSPKFFGALLLIAFVGHEFIEIGGPWVNALIKAWTGIDIPLP